MIGRFSGFRRTRQLVSKTSSSTGGLQTAGFSLTELLVVIAIIGVLAALAVPSIFNVTRVANEAKNRRNAQSIASLANAAKAAGATNIFDTENVVPALVMGISANGLRFSLSPLDPAEVVAAKEFLTNSTPPGVVLYISDPH